MDWFDKAACKDYPSEIFYADGEDKDEDAKREAMAKVICKKCPVAAECLMHAIRKDEKYGVWGSFAPKERKNLIQLFTMSKINIDLCKSIVNKEVKTIKAKMLRGDWST